MTYGSKGYPVSTDNKAIVRRAYLEGMNRRDMAVIKETFSPDYVKYFPAGQGELRGIDELTPRWATSSTPSPT